MFKVTPDPDGKHLIFKGHNGQFLTRYDRNNHEAIEASKPYVDECCRFEPVTASVVPVTETIKETYWGALKNPDQFHPTLLSQQSINNNGSTPITKVFTFEEDYKTTNKTSWEYAWGLTTSMSIGAKVDVDIADVSEQFDVEVNYNGKRSGIQGQSNTISIKGRHQFNTFFFIG